MNEYIIIFLVAVFIASVSQMILKKSANINRESLLKEYLNKYVIIGYLSFFLSTLLIVYAYKGLEFKYGSVLEASGYFMVLILSNIFLKEKITWVKIVGNIIIVIGILIFNL